MVCRVQVSMTLRAVADSKTLSVVAAVAAMMSVVMAATVRRRPTVKIVRWHQMARPPASRFRLISRALTLALSKAIRSSLSRLRARCLIWNRRTRRHHRPRRMTLPLVTHQRGGLPPRPQIQSTRPWILV